MAGRLQPVIAVEGLETSFATKGGTFKAVNGVSYAIHKGETIGVVGESGCGKSVTSLSIMRLLGGTGRVTGGSIHFNGRNVLDMSTAEVEAMRGKGVAMIFQEPMTALNPVYTIGFQIDEQIARHEGMSPKEARHRTIEMLDLVGIPSPEARYKNYPHQLSGGMRQRAMIAMALSCNPECLIADEPTTALDVTIQAQILELIAELQHKRDMAVQFITHDLGVISEVADRVVVMYAGTVCESAPTSTIFSRPRHPYTKGLMESVPGVGLKRHRLATIPGSVPSPLKLPPGCPFQNRCSRATDICRQQRPEPQEVAPGHTVACFNKVPDA
jgi:peptide/nickel transport system ATP-binding protein